LLSHIPSLLLLPFLSLLTSPMHPTVL